MIVKDLASFQYNIDELLKELSQYTWDIESPLVVISMPLFLAVLKKCIDDEINFQELVNWANAIEGRDDIGFENDTIQEIVFELANPEINGEITKERLSEIVNLFS